MIKFFQSNYNRSLWIFRIAVAVFCSLACFLTVEYYVFVYSEIYSLLPIIRKNVFIYIAVGVFFSVFFELFARVFVIFGLRISRIYTIPKHELTVWVMGAVVVKCALTAAFNALYFVSPVIVSFGAIPFTFAVNAAVFIGLWVIIKKLYLNDSNSTYAFRALALAFAVLTAVSLFGGSLL